MLPLPTPQPYPFIKRDSLKAAQLVNDLRPLVLTLILKCTSHFLPSGLVAFSAKSCSEQCGDPQLPPNCWPWRIPDRLLAGGVSGLVKLMKNFPLSCSQHWVKF